MAEGKFESLMDVYTKRARLYPVLLVSLPLGLAAIAHFEKEPSGWSLIWGILLWCGVSFFLTQVGRDLGLKKQQRLFKNWGGMPTTSMLRYRDSPNNVSLLRRHEKLKKLLPELKLPSRAGELENPKEADQEYVHFLRSKTRDQKAYPLIFEENCNYGFRRNLWGMKPLGIIFSILGIVVIIIVILTQCVNNDLAVSPVIMLSGIINITILLNWLFVIQPSWVKTAADAYATQLFASLDVL